MKPLFFIKIILSLLIVNFASSQDHQEEKFKEIALEIINSAKYSVLTTVNNSSADSRTMDHFKVNPDFILYFGTNINSRKINHIKNNPIVTVHFNSKDNDGYVTVKGFASISDNSDLIEHYWKNEWDKFYPNKSNYRLIKVKIQSFEIISEKHNILGDSITWKSPIVLID